MFTEDGQVAVREEIGSGKNIRFVERPDLNFVVPADAPSRMRNDALRAFKSAKGNQFEMVACNLGGRTLIRMIVRKVA